MGRYLNILTSTGIERHFYKYSFATQPSEVHLICELPEISDNGLATVYVQETDGIFALLVDEAEELSAYLLEWVAAHEMEDDFTPPDRAYGPAEKETYESKIPIEASEHFVEMVEAIAEELSLAAGECFIWES